MHGKKERGSEWNEIFSEAKSRLDKTEPIFWLVALNKDDKKDVIRVGESTYFSGLYVDDDGLLQRSNPEIRTTDLNHYCDCCTHTFNGQVY